MLFHNDMWVSGRFRRALSNSVRGACRTREASRRGGWGGKRRDKHAIERACMAPETRYTACWQPLSWLYSKTPRSHCSLIEECNRGRPSHRQPAASHRLIFSCAHAPECNTYFRRLNMDYGSYSAFLARFLCIVDRICGFLVTKNHICSY